MLRIGHKGADALVPGNTLESFAAAVEAGVDAIEFDVLRPRGDFDRRRATGVARPPARAAPAGRCWSPTTGATRPGASR